MKEASAKRVTRGFGTWNDGTQLSRPQGLCCIGRHVYVSDSDNHVLKRFSSALLDNLEVVAGMGRSVWRSLSGDALSTSLTAPSSVFPGAGGEIFITSSWDAMLWRLDGGKLRVKVGMAGSGFQDGPCTSAKLEAPTGGCYAEDIDTTFLVDSDEGRIRYIRGDYVKSIGSGESDRSADGNFSECSFILPFAICQATHASDPTFYVTEFSCIRSVRFNQHLVTTYAGSNKPGFADGPRKIAQFRELKEIACAKDRTLFVADYGNERIRVVSPKGIVSTLVGPLIPPAFLGGALSDVHKPGPVGLCLTPHGDLVFTQPKLNLVQVVHSAIAPELVECRSYNYPTPVYPQVPLADMAHFNDNSEANPLRLPQAFLSLVHPNVLARFEKFHYFAFTAGLPMEEVASVLATESFPVSWSPTSSINMLHIVKQCRLAPQFRNSLLVELEMRLNSVPLPELLNLLTHVEIQCDANKRLGSVLANAILMQMSSTGITELPPSLSAFGVGRFENELLTQLSNGVKFVPKAIKLGDSHIRSSLERLYGAAVSSQRLSADKPSKQENDLVASLTPCNFHIVSHDGYPVPCHDWLLYSRWPYFRHLVESGSEEWNVSKKIQIPSDTFSRHTLRAFVKYLYTNRVDAVSNNDVVALEILLHAQRFNLADMSSPPIAHREFAPLLSACEIIFHQVFTLDNCVDKYNMAKDYGREAHQLRIALFIAEHFEQLMASEKSRWQVLALGAETLATIWVWVSGGPRHAFEPKSAGALPGNLGITPTP